MPFVAVRDSAFSRFDTIPACDGLMDKQTDDWTDTRRRLIPH